MQSTSPAVEQRLQATKEHLTRTAISSSPEASWIHPYLRHSVHPVKGRQLQVSQTIKKGELLLVDIPYAAIPTVDEPLRSENVLCSNSRCNRKAPLTAERVSCPNNCIADVVWCNEDCHRMDQPRHTIECAWLKKFAASIRSKWGEYDFGMLWLIVRILTTRTVGMRDTQRACPPRDDQGAEFKAGWAAIESLCGSPESWPHDKVRHWTALVKKYLKDNMPLAHGMAMSDVLALICREEANSFGLYPRETGTSVSEPQMVRGEQFGAAVYPRAAIANHSCDPNIKHKPDIYGRMVFVASRDIPQGEECCISYFDLSQCVDLKDRRAHLQSSFRFVCGCLRCTAEEPPSEDVLWDAFPLLEE
ncbi:hypothetical protein FE257_005909 [Aspergillus nanangensis]|uniref:SET domain-containing protein n=1 Tax=Aspergillus nanangensis TaxID=2582783 RepID=A0AAD4GUD3_ASPNN|nr:hypothetical protein FE257_005909 [Aspergillus nanangensis]